jgi:hypothetical protein
MTKQKNAFMAGAAVPENPCEGCSYRHRDNAPNGYFDEMLEHSREEMRHACRLVPIEQKPCLGSVIMTAKGDSYGV